MSETLAAKRDRHNVTLYALDSSGPPPRAGIAADLAGRRFGAWTVLGFAGRTRRESGGRVTTEIVWRCRCDCGTEAAVNASNLKAGRSARCRRCPLPRRARPEAA